MKRKRSPATHDSRGKIAHILNPRTQECIAYTGISHTTRSCLGYGVAFDESKLPNLSGSVPRDKSGYRCELRAIHSALHEIARSVSRSSSSSNSLVATAAAAAEADDDTRTPISYIVYSCHEYAVGRINTGQQEIGSGASGAGSAIKMTESSITGTTTNSEVNHTPCLDFLLQIRLLLHYITSQGHQAKVVFIAQTVPGIALANQLAREAISKAQRHPEEDTQQLAPLSIYSTKPPTEFQMIFTDGSSILTGADTVAGYGVFFGICDPRNETGTVRGLGTGPRGALAGILRAITQISVNNRGHKKWEIVSCRGQYIKSIFELSQQWKINGWRRSANKPIASLDIYRAARRQLDDLHDKGFEVKGTYVPVKQMHLGLLAADIMARRGAGDTSIEMTGAITEDPMITIDDRERTVMALVEEYPISDQGVRVVWIGRFVGKDESVYQGPITGNRDDLGKALYAISKVLRHIESESERRWRVGTKNRRAVQLLLSSTTSDVDTRPMQTETDRRKRAAVLEPIMSTLNRLKRHGYEIKFFFVDDNDRNYAAKVEEDPPSLTTTTDF